MGRGIFFYIHPFSLFLSSSSEAERPKNKKLLGLGKERYWVRERGEKSSAADRETLACRYCLIQPTHQNQKRKCYISPQFLWKWKGLKNVKEFLRFFLYTLFYSRWPCDHYPFPFPGTNKKNTHGLRFSADDYFSYVRCLWMKWNFTCISNFSWYFSFLFFLVYSPA